MTAPPPLSCSGKLNRTVSITLFFPRTVKAVPLAAGADRGCLKDQPNTRSVWVSHQANHSLFLKIGLRDPVLANSRENFLDQSPKAARCSQYMSGLRKDESEVKSCASGDIIGAD